MTEQTPDPATSEASSPAPEDQAPEQAGSAPAEDRGPALGTVVTFWSPDTNGGRSLQVGLVSEVFTDRRHHPDDTWGEPELFARVAQLPDAGVFAVADLNPDQD